MTVSLYEVSIPVLIHGLTNLSAVLQKASAHAETKKIDPSAFLQARLYPDMLPLTRQVQIACDTAKGAAARLAGIESPKHEDNETTFAELQARIAKTIDFIKTVKPEQLRDAQSRTVVLKFPSNTLTFNGLDYLNLFVLPNLNFHITIAYALLRHGGVELAKRDFLGKIQ